MMKGHNEIPVRLDLLASDIQQGWASVEKGEAEAVEGWLVIGRSLNEARSLFPSDEKFGQWVSTNLVDTIHSSERAAAMWAAANRDQFEEARAAGKARTVRGIHDRWKQIEAEREKAARDAERKAEEERKRAEAEAARKAAEEKAAAEAEARKAAAEAKTEDARREAEGKAEAAAAEKAEAEKAAEQAEAEAAAAAPTTQEDQQTARLRKEYRKLTAEAQEEDWIGLKVENADLRAKAKASKAEIADLKSKVAELSSGESGAVIAALNKRLKQANNEKWRQTEETGRVMKQVYALKKRVTELEQQEIIL